jgi:hypothetical protein
MGDHRESSFTPGPKRCRSRDGEGTASTASSCIAGSGLGISGSKQVQDQGRFAVVKQQPRRVVIIVVEQRRQVVIIIVEHLRRVIGRVADCRV